MTTKPLSIKELKEQLKVTGRTRKNRQTEASAQTALSMYVKLKYPDVIFTAESSGIKTTIGQAMKMKANRSEGKLPDFICLEARGGYFGLILEIKKPGFDFIKALTKDKVGDKHAKEQEKVLKKLQSKGYLARFVDGFDKARACVDNYMDMPLNADNNSY